MIIRLMLRHTTHAALFISLIAALFVTPLAWGEPYKAIPRRLPPVGIALSKAEYQKVQAASERLDQRLKALTAAQVPAALLPDVEIFAKAARYALIHGEFYKPSDVKIALDLVATAEQRLDALEKGSHPWTAQSGLVVRGFRSAIDGSAQPYGLEIPVNLPTDKPVPLYVWLHGRGDTDTDLHFIRERQTHKGQIHPAGAIVLHPFGRQCIGFKSAGETDVFEAIASVESRYKIDPNRVVMMGFSMGGAGAWHLNAHFADRFAAGHAGAGFVDVSNYQHLTPAEYPAWYEQKLWGLYDVPDYVRNLFNLPFIAYGGEIDPQRASSELMAKAFESEGHKLHRLVGPKMPHRYDPASLAEIMQFIGQAVDKGRDPFPQQLSLQTRTLRYHRMFWASIDGLGEHWLDSRLDARLTGNDKISIVTKNVTRLSLDNPWPVSAESAVRTVEVTIDGKSIALPAPALRTGPAIFCKSPAGWGPAAPDAPGALRKKPGLQGPIDDVFYDPFLVVIPTGRCASPQVQQWVDFELKHFQDRWREVFRGDLRMKKDTEVTPQDIETYHLVLWGDPHSNRLIGQVIGKLPVQWTGSTLAMGPQKFDRATHVPLLVYPDPLNPAKYVILNSGPTFREDSDRTNSLQNPKLPDWAIVDVTTPPDGKLPGKIAAADFFDEQWHLKPRTAPKNNETRVINGD